MGTQVQGHLSHRESLRQLASHSTKPNPTPRAGEMTQHIKSCVRTRVHIPEPTALPGIPSPESGESGSPEQAV